MNNWLKLIAAVPTASFLFALVHEMTFFWVIGYEFMELVNSQDIVRAAIIFLAPTLISIVIGITLSATLSSAFSYLTTDSEKNLRDHTVSRQRLYKSWWLLLIIAFFILFTVLFGNGLEFFIISLGIWCASRTYWWINDNLTSENLAVPFGTLVFMIFLFSYAGISQANNILDRRAEQSFVRIDAEEGEFVLVRQLSSGAVVLDASTRKMFWFPIKRVVEIHGKPNSTRQGMLCDWGIHCRENQNRESS